jgi:hypothetical protein
MDKDRNGRIEGCTEECVNRGDVDRGSDGQREGWTEGGMSIPPSVHPSVYPFLPLSTLSSDL